MFPALYRTTGSLRLLISNQVAPGPETWQVGRLEESRVEGLGTLVSRAPSSIPLASTQTKQNKPLLKHAPGPEAWRACRLEEGLGAETMTLLKKMRLLQRKGSEMEPKKVMEKTRKYLASVGDAVAEQARTKGRSSTRNIQRWRERLWEVGGCGGLCSFACVCVCVCVRVRARARALFVTVSWIGSLRCLQPTRLCQLLALMPVPAGLACAGLWGGTRLWGVWGEGGQAAQAAMC